MWVLPAPLLPMAMMFSLRSTYSHLANCVTSCLFTDGIARKSKVSRLLTVGKRAALMRLSTMRWCLSMSSSSGQPEPVVGMAHPLSGTLRSHLPVLPEEGR